MAESVVINNDYELVLDTEIDITGASIKKILYQKPDGNEGSWTATDRDDTKLVVDVTDTINDQAKDWYFRSYIEEGGKKHTGEKVRLEVETEW